MSAASKALPPLRWVRHPADDPRARLHVGMSGWIYPPWRGVFFPKGWSQKRELEFASRELNSIEINGSFYSLQRPSSFNAWYEATPPGFVFSLKAGRYITHIRKLKDVDAPLANFFASGVLCLREKLGPILWQLPPSFRYDAELLADFFKLLPRNTESASILAGRHDGMMEGRAHTTTDQLRPVRHALEVRNASFEHPDFIQLLRDHDIGLVVGDTAGKWPFMEEVTSDFLYIRMHGDEKLYASGYTDAALDEWARKIQTWAAGGTPPNARRVAPGTGEDSPAGRDVFVYFDNDLKVRSPYDAMSLAHRLGIGASPGAPPDLSSVAEPALGADERKDSED